MQRMIDILIGEHDGCKNCKYEFESDESIHCIGCKQNSVDKYIPMTNGEALRMLTNEVLADFICKNEMNHQDLIEWLNARKEGDFIG